MKPRIPIRIFKWITVAITAVGLFCASTGHSEFEESSKEKVVKEAELFVSENEVQESDGQQQFLYHVDLAKTSDSIRSCDRFRIVPSERNRFNGAGAYLLI